MALLSQKMLDVATDADAAFDRLVCVAVAQLEAGKRVDLSAIAANSPEQAERLAQLLPALEAMATLGANEPDLLTRAGAGPTNGAGKVSTSGTQRGLLGDFRIVRELGRGGMGVVYEAEQVSLGRRVALKVLPFAAMLGEQQLKRFKNEARAAATLKHPNIVSVYSVGCDRGVHYYAMELVEGESLDRAICQLRNADCGLRNEEKKDLASVFQSQIPNPKSQISSPQSAIRNPQSEIPTAPIAALSTHGPTDSPGYFRNIARLGIEAADALQHAHELGIIHRDIKPANLIVDTAGKLWITDFGLARIEADAGLTMSGDMLGTLRYMSPEQALGQGVADQRADIYSLGVTLYELATLQPAYGALDRKQLLHEIATADPRPPRQVNRRIPVDLDTIIRKAIERDVADRYGSAKELADDLRRFLASEPIRAKAASVTTRALKWSRRHHTLVAAVGLLGVVLAGVLAIAAVFIERSRATAETALEESSRHRERMADLLYAADISLASQAWKDNDLLRATELLREQIPPKGGVDRRDIEWYFLQKLCTSKFVSFASVDSAIYDFALSPDGTQLAAVGQDAMLRVYDVASKRLLAEINTLQSEVNGVTYFPDGQTIVTSGDDGTLRLWHKLRSQAHKVINAHDGIAFDVAYSGAADCLITSGEDSQIKLWNPITGDLIGTLSGHTAPVTVLAVSHDGKLLASASRDRTVRRWNLETHAEIHVQTNIPRGISLTFDRPAEALIIGTVSNFANHMITILLDTNHLLSNALPAKETTSLTVSPDGKLLAAGTDGGVIWVWEADQSPTDDNLTRNASWSAHTGKIHQLAFTPEGEHLLSAGEDGNIRQWENPIKRMESGQLEILGHVKSIAPVAQRPLMAAIGDEGIAVVEIPTGRIVQRLANASNYTSIAVSNDGTLVAAGEKNRLISVWQLNSPEPSVATDYQLALNNAVSFSPDGSTLAAYSQSHDDGLVLIDLRSGKMRSGFVAHGCNEFAWSPDGTFHAAAENQTDAILVHSSATGELIHRIKHHQTTICDLAVSPNSRWIASADDSHQIALWDARSGERIWSGRTNSVGGTRGYPQSLGFTPRGKTLLALSNTGAIDAFHVATGRGHFQFDESRSGAASLQLCAGGKYICYTSSGRLRVIDTGFRP
ncbi:MAG: protein kinase [Pirellulales bacterium]